MKAVMKFLLVCLAAMNVATAAETATIIRATQLMDAPYSDAQSLGLLRGETSVEIRERQGGWYRVTSDEGREGWVRLSSLRLGEAKQEERGGFWASVFSFTGRSQTRTASATTGIRGLSEEDIHSATPDVAAVDKLRNFAVNDGQAEAFAGEIGLVARKIDDIDNNKSGKTERSRP